MGNNINFSAIGEKITSHKIPLTSNNQDLPEKDSQQCEFDRTDDGKTVIFSHHVPSLYCLNDAVGDLIAWQDSLDTGKPSFSKVEKVVIKFTEEEYTLLVYERV